MKRLLTKADRDSSRQYQFDSLTKNGYQKTEYKNLIIFSHPTELLLKSFWGTAANHTDFFRYKTAEQLTAKIESLKATADSREKWKAEQKERNKGYKSNQAAAAAAIKAELKKVFPLIKFSVTSESFSGGDSVNISWTDGPQRDAVENITGKYQYGHFNGMEDIYENTNSRDDIPQAKYVSEHRTISEELTESVKIELTKLKIYTDEEIKSYRDNPTEEARRLLYITDVPTSYKGLQVVRNDDSKTNTDFYKIVFDVEQTEPAQPTAAEVPAGKIQVVDYSEKAFAVIGEFSEHFDNLINLGGKYNKYLKCGRGIIFSKTKLEAVKAYLIASKGSEPTEPQKAAEQPETTLRDEVVKTVQFFAEHDIKVSGKVTESTKEVARVQNVSLFNIEEETPQHYDNLQDMETAAKGGKVISLLNMYELVNTK